MVEFQADVFRNKPSKHVVFTDIWQREEYALFRGGGAQGEIVYVTLRNSLEDVSLDYPYTLEQTLDLWNFNRKHRKVLGEAVRVDRLNNTYFFRPYTLTDVNRKCVGFDSQWDMVARDPKNWPGSVLFGYYCAKPGKNLDLDQMADLVRRVHIKGVTDWLKPSAKEKLDKAANEPVDANVQAEAVRIARGPSPDADTGIPKFPLKMAESFSTDGGGDKNTSQ